MVIGEIPIPTSAVENIGMLVRQLNLPRLMNLTPRIPPQGSHIHASSLQLVSNQALCRASAVIGSQAHVEELADGETLLLLDRLSVMANGFHVDAVLAGHFLEGCALANHHLNFGER